MRFVLLLVLLFTSCVTKGGDERETNGNSANGATGAESERERILPHERYLKHPTRIEADQVLMILPAEYAEEIEVSGLTAGWQTRGPNRVWEGSGNCELKVLSLTIVTRDLVLTVVPDQEEQVVNITATGNVICAHSVRGMGNYDEWSFLVITNEGRKGTP